MHHDDSSSEHARRGGTPSRRTVARGLAWSVPVVAGVAAAPAMASSPAPRLTQGATAGWNNPFYRRENHCSQPVFGSNAPVVVDGRGVLGTSNQTWDGVWFPETLGHYSICDVRVTFWLATSNATFTPLPGVADWSTPTRTGRTASVNRETYHEYAATYRSGACLRAEELRSGYNGWYGIPFGWKTTQCFTRRPGTLFRVGVTATVRGEDLTYLSEWANMS